MIHTRKTTQDILQEEVLRERAAILARAGELLEEAFAKLRKIEREIEEETSLPGLGDEGGSQAFARSASAGDERLRRIRGINDRIRAYNRQREHVRTRLYYLIVTREAMGLIHHQRHEEIYRIPPRKRVLPEG